MFSYESCSLILTGVYSVLTFFLLAFVAYESLVKPKLGNPAVYLRGEPTDTEQKDRSLQLMDFVIDNRGSEIKNIKISSIPDNVGFRRIGREVGQATSEYFAKPIPYLASGERRAFLWCDVKANMEVLKKPFEIIVEYENISVPFPFSLFEKRKKRRKSIKIDSSAFHEIIWGVNEKYDIHNVAEELARIRKDLDAIKEFCDSNTQE